MRRATQPIAPQEQRGQEAATRQGQEDVVAADERRVAGEHQEQRPAHRHLALEWVARRVARQQGDELVGVRRFRDREHRRRPQREHGAGQGHRCHQRPQGPLHHPPARLRYGGRQLRDALQAGEGQERAGVAGEDPQGRQTWAGEDARQSRQEMGRPDVHDHGQHHGQLARGRDDGDRDVDLRGGADPNQVE